MLIPHDMLRPDLYLMLGPCSLIKLFPNINIEICKKTVFLCCICEQGMGSKQLPKDFKLKCKNGDKESTYYYIWQLAGSQ